MKARITEKERLEVEMLGVYAGNSRVDLVCNVENVMDPQLLKLESNELVGLRVGNSHFKRISFEAQVALQ